MGEVIRILYDEELVQTMANFNLGNLNVYGGNFELKARVLDNILINGSNLHKRLNLKGHAPNAFNSSSFGSIKLKLMNEKSQYQLSYRFSAQKMHLHTV